MASLAQMIDIQDATRMWALHDVHLIADTPGSHVYRAQQAGVDSVVVKLLKPRGLEEVAGMDFLEWRQGIGAVRLIERRGNACLLNDAGTQTLEDLRAERGELAANAAFATVLAELHAHSRLAAPSGLIPLEHHFHALTERGAPADSRHADDLTWAAGLARHLLSNQTRVRPLHGDLHHENIMSRDGAHWIAIDPHGLIGDPVYDAANYFGNPLHKPDITLDRARILGIARCFAPVLDCDVRKILEYAAAHAALSACWSIDDPVSDADFQDAQDRLGFVAVVRDLLAQPVAGAGLQ